MFQNKKQVFGLCFHQGGVSQATQLSEIEGAGFLQVWILYEMLPDYREKNHLNDKISVINYDRFPHYFYSLTKRRSPFSIRAR